MTTEPDDLMACLDVMDSRWDGYSHAKSIIRKRVEEMRVDLDGARLGRDKACEIADERNRHAAESESRVEMLLWAIHACRREAGESIGYSYSLPGKILVITQDILARYDESKKKDKP